MNLQVEALILYAALESGEWRVTKPQPLDCFTDEANERVKLEWDVERLSPPFCDHTGCRTWTGSSPSAALERAAISLGDPSLLVKLGRVPLPATPGFLSKAFARWRRRYTEERDECGTLRNVAND